MARSGKCLRTLVLVIRFKFPDLLLGFIFRDAVGFLNPARQLDTLTVNLVEVIVGELAPLGLYKKYASDASAAEPSLAVIKKDIEDIGKAQTHLALVMVPYHLKAYAALNPVQQTLYRKLVEKQQ